MVGCFISSLVFLCVVCCFVFFFKQKTAYEVRISDWSSDVCSSDLPYRRTARGFQTMDLMLDIVVELDRSWKWKDVEDFEALLVNELIDAATDQQIGRASCRERVCQYV